MLAGVVTSVKNSRWMTSGPRSPPPPPPLLLPPLLLLAAAAAEALAPLAQETGDVRARAENGEELSGVRPYTLEVNGDEEWVYVLQLEGKPGFAQARKRWGFRNNPGNNPPHFDLDELKVLERAGGMLR